MTMIGTLNFYTVQGWMVSELHLTGNELLAYAVIYGFSQDGASAFRGTLAYIAEWLGCSKSSAHRTLKRLTERGLIEASADGGGWVCKPADAIHSVNTEAPEAFQNGTAAEPERSETERAPFQNGTKSFQNGTDTLSNYNNYRDKDTPEKTRKAPKPKKEYGEYKNVWLTDNELDKLKSLYPRDWEDRINRLSAYIASSGKKYRSHYATIRMWADRDKKQQGQARPGGYSGQRQDVPPGMEIGPNGVLIDPNLPDLPM